MWPGVARDSTTKRRAGLFFSGFWCGGGGDHAVLPWAGQALGQDSVDFGLRDSPALTESKSAYPTLPDSPANAFWVVVDRGGKRFYRVRQFAGAAD